MHELERAIRLGGRHELLERAAGRRGAVGRPGRRGGGRLNPYTVAASEAMLPWTALLVSVTGVTHTGDGTPVTQWAGSYGGKRAALTLTPVNAPTYRATGGPTTASPGIETDGTNDNMRMVAPIVFGTGTTGAARFDMFTKVAGAETANDIMARWRPGGAAGDQVSLQVTAAPQIRVTTAGTGGAGPTTGATTVSGAFWMLSLEAISGAGGSQRPIVNNVSDATPAGITHAAWTDDGDITFSASITGATPIAQTIVAIAVTFIPTATAPLSSAQETYLRNLVNYLIPGAS